jgi:hypothetical protein
LAIAFIADDRGLRAMTVLPSAANASAAIDNEMSKAYAMSFSMEDLEHYSDY